MALVEIKSGDDIAAKPLNDNFNELDGKITTVNNSIVSLQATVATMGDTLTSRINEEISEIRTEINNDFKNQPSVSIINGLTVSKYNDNTISVSRGSCYDSTFSMILSLSSSRTKQNASQSISRTYYVYIIGNGEETDILISTDSDSPTVSEGYKYRLIGTYTTDANGNINAVFGNASYSGDGQWVGTEITLSTSNSGEYTIDLSSHLPNDSYAYELLLHTGMYTDGINKNQQLSSSIITSWVSVNHTESYADGSSGACIFPVGADKNLKYRITGGGGSVYLILYGYRRIGTNA